MRHKLRFLFYFSWYFHVENHDALNSFILSNSLVKADVGLNCVISGLTLPNCKQCVDS